MHPVSQTDFTQELKLLGYKNTDNYAKTGSYVTDGSTLFVHTRGFDFGDHVELEQVLQVFERFKLVK